MRRRTKSSARPPAIVQRSASDAFGLCVRYSSLSEPSRAVSSSWSVRVPIQRRHNCTNASARRCVRRSENARIAPSYDRSWVAHKATPPFHALSCRWRAWVLIQVKFERFPLDATISRTAIAQEAASLALGLERSQICHDIRDLILIDPELRHRRMVGDNTFGQATT